jgi:hypothetical protein
MIDATPHATEAAKVPQRAVCTRRSREPAALRKAAR